MTLNIQQDSAHLNYYRNMQTLRCAMSRNGYKHNERIRFTSKDANTCPYIDDIDLHIAAIKCRQILTIYHR